MASCVQQEPLKLRLLSQMGTLILVEAILFVSDDEPKEVDRLEGNQLLIKV